MNRDSEPPTAASAPSDRSANQQPTAPSDDERRSRRRQRRRQLVESRENPSTAPQIQYQQPASSEHYKSELYIMSQQERARKISDSSKPTLSRSPPDSKRTIIRPVSVIAPTLIPSTWQEPTERQRKRSVGRTPHSMTSPTRTGVTSPTRSTVTSPTRDKRHSLNSPTVPMTGGSNFLTINPPSELRVQGTPPGGTRAAIHIIDDFLHNPPRTELQRQRSLTRAGSRGSWKQRERDKEPRTRRVSRSQVTVGLDHLDNLCRLMEQLSSLRDENTKLKKRCNFLENTRELLKIQNEMLLHERDDYDSEEEDTLSLGLSESTLAESQIADDDDEVFSHGSSSVMTTPKPRSQHRRSQSVGSIDLIDVLPALEKQHSIPHASPFTSKFKKSIKHTRNTIKKVFSNMTDDRSAKPVPTITTTSEERNAKTSQSSDRSSTSPCQSEPSREDSQEAAIVPESVQQAKSEMHLHLTEPRFTREVVSDEACTPSRSPMVRRRYQKQIQESQLLTRRKSSPTLTFSKEEVDSDVRRPTTPEIPRSSTTPHFAEYSPKDDKIRGRTAWGKVKDIIHTRKDSLKKRNRKSMDENRRSMTDAIFERKSAEPNESPRFKDQVSKPSSSSDTKLNELDKPKEKLPPSSAVQGAPNTKALQELVGNLSEEFNRKMMEWEKKKGEKSKTAALVPTVTGSVGDRLSDIGSEYKRPQRKISHTTSFPVKLRSADSTSPVRSPTEVTLESLQKGMSDSFNRKMLEWEKMRSGQQNDGYMSVEGIRRDAPWKSRSEKKTKAEKERLRMERFREKELVKVERERQKLERDRQRLQREHQRTIRRAVELERKKEQLEDFGVVVDSGPSKGHAPLSQHQSYPYHSPRRRMYKYVNVGEYQIEGVSDEFAKRLQTWEEKKHKTKDCFHVWDPHSANWEKCKDVGDIVIPPKFKEGQPPLPIVIRSSQGMPEQLENIHTSPQIVRVEPTYQRATLCTHETQTSPQRASGAKESKQFHFDDSISDLRTRNSYLSQQLRQRESESQSLQDDVEGLNRALRRMNESYTKEIASYKHQLWAGSHWGQMSEQSKFVAEAVNELRIRVDQLEDMHCMDARRRPFSGDSSKNNKDKNNSQGSIEAPGKYKNLVDYVKKLHNQISDLKKGVIERDDVLNKFRKHLSLEEINKLLLNADIQRRDLELQFFKKRHKHGVIRRHCTFSGQDFCIRQGCDEKQAFKTWPKYRARCVDKIPTTFRHGNFDPEQTSEKDSDIADVLRTCGISSDDPDKHQDFLNGNSAVPAPRRHQHQEMTPTRSIAVQVGWDDRERYGEEYWPRDERHYPHSLTVHVRRPDHRRDSDSDNERRSRIDYGRRQMREAFFSSVTHSASPPRRSQDGSLSPNYRQTKSPPGDCSSGTPSFRVRSATYFSPKPYGKPQDHAEDHQRLEPPQNDAMRRIGPLRKLHSASELMSERRTAIANRYQSSTEVRHSSLMDRKTREDYFTDIEARRSQLLQQQDMVTSQTNIVSGVDVPTLAQSYDQPQDNEAGGQSVPSKELPQEGTVRRLTEVFVSGLTEQRTNGHTRSKYSCERVTDAMQRKRSMEAPKEGTVQKRLEEFIPYQSGSRSSETSPTLKKRQSEIPREGTVQKRLEELKLYSESDRTGPDGKESRKSDSDDTAALLLPIGRKDTVSSTDEDYSSKGHSDDEPFTATTRISHQSILLRPQPIGQQRERSKRLSPMEMLVRGTVSLNLDVVSPRYDDVEPSAEEPPLSPGGTNTKRRSWFARSFFKSQK